MVALKDQATTSYIGTGRKRVLEETFFRVRIPPTNYDPLAQTFQFSDDKYLTSLNLYFYQKDSVDDVTVEIRETTNGYPNTNVIASSTINPSNVKVSNNGSIATNVKFRDPVLLFANETYCFVVLTKSTKYFLWTAKLGGVDIVSKSKVARQPYEIGVMFSSSNGTAWSAHQDTDIKFDLNVAKFKDKSELYYQAMPVDKATKLVLLSNQLVPKGGSINWFWSLDGVKDWKPVENNTFTELNEEVTKIFIKSVLNTNGSSAVVENSVGAVALAYKKQGLYISRELTVQENFTNITVYVDMYTPSGTNQSVLYSLDNVSWIPIGSAVSQVKVDELYTRYKFTKTVASSSKVRVQILQGTDVPTITPKAKNLMVHVS